MSNLTLPGLIDPHVHLRDPGQTEKEDFYTGTCAALAGGYTTVIDMPNNKIPITTLQSLDEKIKIAKEKIVCNVGFYFGSLGDKLDEFKKVQDKVFGLKLYLNETTGNFLVSKNLLENIFSAWRKTNISLQSIMLHSTILLADNPILVHAEDKTVEDVINIVKKIRVPTHFCHISQALELKMILNAKQNGLPVTCGVTPHHLFLTEHDVKTLGAFAKMKPPLRSQKNADFLWKNIHLIDVIESDHAPHTIREKTGRRGVTRLEGLLTARTRSVPKERLAEQWREGKAWQDPERSTTHYGIPGLETTLPLLLTAVSENRLTIEDIIRLCFKNPSRIFGVGKNCDGKVEVDLHKSYTIENGNLFTKCKWSPFSGWKVKGKIQRVFIRGTKVFEDGKILAKPGFGKILKSVL